MSEKIKVSMSKGTFRIIRKMPDMGWQFTRVYDVDDEDEGQEIVLLQSRALAEHERSHPELNWRWTVRYDAADQDRDGDIVIVSVTATQQLDDVMQLIKDTYYMGDAS